MPIFDQGYQHWKGSLSGHAWRWLAIARHGVRLGMQNRTFRMVLLVSFLPALALAAALCVWGLVERNSDFVSPIAKFFVGMNWLSYTVVSHPKDYRVEIWTVCYWHFLSWELTIAMILVLLVGPNLISQDLRFNALPLYLSRPLRRTDYLAGKLGVIAAFLGYTMIVPSVAAYVLGLLFSFDSTIFRDTWRVLLASLAYGIVIIVSAGTLMLALSSLSRNSRYIALFWVGLWAIGNIAALALESTQQFQRRQAEIQRSMDSGRRRPAFGDVAFQEAELEGRKKDWRPMVSYTGNLARIGNQLLGTDACYEKFSELEPKQAQAWYRLNHLGPQYPWYWSAAVLAGLFGLSVCILSLSVRSLDRLR